MLCSTFLWKFTLENFFFAKSRFEICVGRTMMRQFCVRFRFKWQKNSPHWSRISSNIFLKYQDIKSWIYTFLLKLMLCKSSNVTPWIYIKLHKVFLPIMGGLCLFDLHCLWDVRILSLKETPIEAARASWSMIPLKLKLPKSLYISRSMSFFLSARERH